MFILLTHNHIKRLEYQFYIHENYIYKYIMFTDITKKYLILLDIKIEHISGLLHVVCFMDMPPTWFLCIDTIKEFNAHNNRFEIFLL